MPERARRAVVAIIGDGRLDPGDARANLAVELGRRLIDAGHRLLTGGLGGVMAAASAGARSSGCYREGDVIGLLPGLDHGVANPDVDIALATGLGDVRNTLVAAADAIIAIGGGAGTLSELAYAWLHDRPILAFRVGGWSGRLADSRLDDRRRIPRHADDRVHGVDTPAEAVALLPTVLAWHRREP